MFIRKLEFRNVGSYGNKPQEINFEDKASFYLVLGNNGFGKSTISQVIKLCLYGKTGDGKKLKDIPNRINKNAWMKMYLETKIGNVVIERGFEPTFLKLYINDIEYDQAGKKEVQNYLEEEILEIPFYVFNNIISLSINDFKSFVKMTPYDKKSIIDKIFGFSIINQMRDSIKSEIKNIKEYLDKLDGKLSTLVSNVDSSISELNNLNEKLIIDSNTKRNELVDHKAKIEVIKVKIEERIQQFLSQEREFADQKYKLKDALNADKMTIRSIEEKEKLYAGDKCPTCSSDLHTDFHQNIIDGYLDLKEKTKRTFESNSALYLELETKEREIRNLKSEMSEKLRNADIKIKVVERALQELTTSKTKDQTESLNNLITNLQEQLKDGKNKQYKLNKKSSYLNILDEILGEKGLKQLAIKTILPALNSEIYNLMQSMHLDYRVIFDEEFDAHISHYGYEDINSSSLSTGEMKKVDFAVLVAIIKLMKLKFPSVNLLFLDEIFSSLDADSRFTILKILKNVVEELNLNTFVINHSEMPHEEFDYTLRIEKNDHFSSFTLEKLGI